MYLYSRKINDSLIFETLKKQQIHSYFQILKCLFPRSGSYTLHSVTLIEELVAEVQNLKISVNL